jgi:hypothetical protein
MPTKFNDSCPYILQSGHHARLDLMRFSVLHAEGQRLVKGWFDRAYELIDDDNESFEGFIFAWFAVNGWAACVTTKDRDSDYIAMLGRSLDLREKFVKLLANNSGFSLVASQFHAFWPIFKAQDIRRAGHHGLSINDRKEIIEYYFQNGITSYAPECWQFHQSLGEEIPLDWPHTLQAIYRVRNNLFHGEKSAHSEMDQLIVKLAFQTLIRFFRGAEIL